ncbi:hypothetical protein D3C71_1171560 [compost metagenome]
MRSGVRGRSGFRGCSFDGFGLGFGGGAQVGNGIGQFFLFAGDGLGFYIVCINAQGAGCGCHQGRAVVVTVSVGVLGDHPGQHVVAHLTVSGAVNAGRGACFGVLVVLVFDGLQREHRVQIVLVQILDLEFEPLAQQLGICQRFGGLGRFKGGLGQRALQCGGGGAGLAVGGLLLELADALFQVDLLYRGLEHAALHQHGLGLLGGHGLDQLLGGGVLDEHGLGAFVAQQLAQCCAVFLVGDIVPDAVQPGVAVQHVAVAVPRLELYDALGFLAFDHAHALGLGLGTQGGAVSCFFAVVAGGVGAQVWAVHIGEQIRVGAGALGAILAATSCGHQLDGGDVEGGAVQPQHDVLLQPALKLTHAYGGVAPVVLARCFGQGFGLQLGVWDAGNAQGAAGVDQAFAQCLGGLGGQVQQLEAGVHIAFALALAVALAYLFGHLFHGEVAVLHQGAVALGLLQLAHVHALQVLDELDLQRLVICQLPDHGGHFGHLGEAAGAQAACAGHQFVGGQGGALAAKAEGLGQARAGQRPQQDGLVHAAGFDAVCQLLQLGGVEGFAGVGEALFDEGYLHHAHLGACAGCGQGLGYGVVCFSCHGGLPSYGCEMLG